MYSTFYTVKTKHSKQLKTRHIYIIHSRDILIHTPQSIFPAFTYGRSHIIIYMKKFLDCDWLRGMQFLGNTVQKKGNWVHKKDNLVQKRVTSVTFWLANKQRNSLRANQMRHLNGTKFGSAPDQFRAKTAMVGICKTHFLWRPKQL